MNVTKGNNTATGQGTSISVSQLKQMKPFKTLLINVK